MSSVMSQSNVSPTPPTSGICGAKENVGGTCKQIPLPLGHLLWANNDLIKTFAPHFPRIVIPYHNIYINVDFWNEFHINFSPIHVAYILDICYTFTVRTPTTVTRVTVVTKMAEGRRLRSVFRLF